MIDTKIVSCEKENEKLLNKIEIANKLIAIYKYEQYEFYKQSDLEKWEKECEIEK